jgi:hypothetical protein
MLHRRLSGEAARARGEDGTENREFAKRQDLYNDSRGRPGQLGRREAQRLLGRCKRFLFFDGLHRKCLTTDICRE